MTSLPGPYLPSPLLPPHDSGLWSSLGMDVQTFHVDMDKGQALAPETTLRGTQNRGAVRTVFSLGLTLEKISQLINQ